MKYTVDDGTGVVDCVVFTQSQDGTAKVGVPSFRLGDTVSVRGRLRLPRDLYAVGKPLRELIVVTARRCRDDNEQFVHWADVMLLSRTFYSKPLREVRHPLSRCLAVRARRAPADVAAHVGFAIGARHSFSLIFPGSSVRKGRQRSPPARPAARAEQLGRRCSNQLTLHQSACRAHSLPTPRGHHPS